MNLQEASQLLHIDWWDEINHMPQMDCRHIKDNCDRVVSLRFFEERFSTDVELRQLVAEFETLWHEAYYATDPVLSTWFMRHVLWPLLHAKPLRNKMRECYSRIADRRHVLQIKLNNLFP